MFSLVDSMLCVLAVVSLGVLFSGYAAIVYKRLERLKVASPGYGVSVLKPLKGADEGLLENLRAIARQDYPAFEVIFGAEDPCDPALDVARQVAREFPHVSMRVVSGAFASGLNPKVRILRHLLPFATHRWILISDSNVRPDPGYLEAITRKQAKHDAALVHSMLAGTSGQSLGGRLEELQLNGWVAASIALSDMLGHSCVIGKSMLIDRQALAGVGGLGEVADILAEDYILGAMFQRVKRKVVISAHLLHVMTGKSRLQHFFNRHIRWSQMRRRIAPGFYLLELTGNPSLFLFLAWTLRVFFPMRADSTEWLTFNWMALAQLLKWLADAVVYLILTPRPSALTMLLIPAKDALVPVMWVLGGVRRTVHWRGQKMLVGSGSRLSPAHPLPAAS